MWHSRNLFPTFGTISTPALMSAAATTAIVVVSLVFVARPVHAAAAVTAATGGGAISVDTAATAASPAWTDLGATAITEGAVDDIAVEGPVTIILTAPAGFEFNTAQAVDTVGTGADLTSVVTPVSYPSATTMEITYTAGGIATSDVIDIGGVTPIQVRPTGGTPTSGNILRDAGNPGTGTAIVGINGTTNFGTLTSVVGAVSQLAVTTQPAGATAGAVFGTQPVVKTQDQFGNLSTTGLGANLTVTASINVGTGPLQGTAGLDIGTAAGNGVVTYTDLRMDVAQAGVTLDFAATGLTTATSAALSVGHAAASQLVLTTSPSASTVQGVPFAQQPIVQIKDVFNNVVTSDSATVVTATLTTGTGTLSGTVTKTAASGVADFTGNGMKIDVTGADKVLTFSGGVLTDAVSGAFAINAPSYPSALTVKEGGLTIQVESTETVATSTTAEVALTTTTIWGSEAVLTVPAGALPEGSTLAVSAVASAPKLGIQTRPPRTVEVTLAFSIKATASDGSAVTADFGEPVNLEFTVAASSVPADATSDQLRLAFWNGLRWVLVDGTVTINVDGTATIAGATDHFTLFAVLYNPVGFGVAFEGELPSTGVGSVTFGGTVEQLESALVNQSCISPIFVTDKGEWVGLVPTAGVPAVNAAFKALFADGIPLGTPMIATGCND